MGDFTISDKGIDPDLIPKSILYTGCEIPMIGLGTFGSDSVSGQQVADVHVEVLEAAVVGPGDGLGDGIGQLVDLVPRLAA